MQLLFDNKQLNVPSNTTILELHTLIGSKHKLLWNTKNLKSFGRRKLLKVVLTKFDDLDKPFYQIFEEYSKKNNIKVKYDKIQVFENLEIKFHKTIKVTDDDVIHALPPTLGKYKIDEIDNKLYIRMKPAEATWISFQQKDADSLAIKVGAGNLNAVSGKLFTPALEQHVQNYLSIPTQPWIDGINVSDGLVRQFVVVSENDSSSIDNRLKEKFLVSERENTIRLHIHRHLSCYKDLHTYIPESRKFVIYTLNPSVCGLKLGSEVFFSVPSDTCRDLLLYDIGVKSGDTIIEEQGITIFVKTLTDKIYEISNIDVCMTVEELKEEIQDVDGLPTDQMRLIYCGRQLSDGYTLSHYNISNNGVIGVYLRLRGGGGECVPSFEQRASIAPGGLIKQKIYLDKYFVSEYTQTYEEIVINLCTDPDSGAQMSCEDYIDKKLPWFTLEDNDKQSVSPDSILGL